jgi:hypothetical protein
MGGLLPPLVITLAEVPEDLPAIPAVMELPVQLHPSPGPVWCTEVPAAVAAAGHPLGGQELDPAVTAAPMPAMVDPVARLKVPAYPEVPLQAMVAAVVGVAEQVEVMTLLAPVVLTVRVPPVLSLCDSSTVTSDEPVSFIRRT